MSKNIFLHEFRTRLKSVLTWSLGISALILFFFSIFPSFAEQAELTTQLLSKFPPALLEAFGMNRMNLSTILGFLSLVMVFIQLCLAIQASNYGFGLVSIEENELTADFLLSKPVSRARVLTSKLLAAVSSLLVTDLVILLVTFISIILFNGGRTYELRTLNLLLLSMPILQLCFLSVGLVISLLVKRVRSVTPYSLGLAFGAYVLNAFAGVFGDVKLEYITPFKHLDPVYIVGYAAFNSPLVLLNLAISLIALGASYWLYIRRDIPAVS
jgi:ABC-2 type transport system permease protein